MTGADFRSGHPRWNLAMPEMTRKFWRRRAYWSTQLLCVGFGRCPDPRLACSPPRRQDWSPGPPRHQESISLVELAMFKIERWTVLLVPVGGS